MEKKDCIALGKIPSGLFIVCSQDPQTKIIDGFLASWIQQISFNPLMVTMAIKPNRPIYQFIVEKKLPFTINIVGNHDKTYLKHFWSGYDPNNNPFEKNLFEYESTSNGGIALKAALASIDAINEFCYTPGDHHLLVAKVIGQKIDEKNMEEKPFVHIRKSGLDY